MQSSRANQLLQLGHRHLRIKRVLQGEKSSRQSYLDLPISMWVHADDRGIPHDLVRQSVRSLLDADFYSLIDAPGVGLVKLRKLLELLERVGTDDSESNGRTDVIAKPESQTTARPDALSESAQWRHDTHVILQAGLSDLSLGRVVSTLSELPRRLWSTPLRQFATLTFEQLHEIPYVGKCRIRSIQQIISDTARAAKLSANGNVGGFVWLARLIHDADDWCKQRLVANEPMSTENVYHGFFKPLITQVEVDLGARTAAVVHHLLRGPLAGIVIQPEANAAVVAGLSRPRISQLKDEIRAACRVRWPNGGQLMQSLIEHSARVHSLPIVRELLFDAADLFFARRNVLRAHMTMLTMSQNASSVGV